MAKSKSVEVFEEIPADEASPQWGIGIGRKPGSKNRILSVEEKLEKLGLDPIVKLAMLAAEAEAAGSVALAMKGYSELAQYTAAKRKSVEVAIAPNSPLDMALSLSSAERMMRITALMNTLSK